MVTVNDVMHHIAQELHYYNGSEHPEEIQEFLIGRIVALHMSVTTDVEATELDYLERYGRGHTFYFRLQDYQHGRELAADIYYSFQQKHPDMQGHTGSKFSPDDVLYLFIHVKDIDPPPDINTNHV